jgi:hypothetical protein
MTNISSIAGGALWAFIASLLVSLALEPVSVAPQTQLVQVESTVSAA